MCTGISYCMPHPYHRCVFVTCLLFLRDAHVAFMCVFRCSRCVCPFAWCLRLCNFGDTMWRRLVGKMRFPYMPSDSMSARVFEIHALICCVVIVFVSRVVFGKVCFCCVCVKAWLTQCMMFACERPPEARQLL